MPCPWSVVVALPLQATALTRSPQRRTPQLELYCDTKARKRRDPGLFVYPRTSTACTGLHIVAPAGSLLSQCRLNPLIALNRKRPVFHRRKDACDRKADEQHPRRQRPTYFSMPLTKASKYPTKLQGPNKPFSKSSFVFVQRYGRLHCTYVVHTSCLLSTISPQNIVQVELQN